MAEDAFWGSPAYARLAGLEEAEAPGNMAESFELVHPDDAGRVHERLDACLRGEVDGYTEAYRLLVRGGDVRWVQEQAMVTARAADGKPTRLAAFVADVDSTVRGARELKQTLREMERHSEQLDTEVEKTLHQMEQTRQMSSAMFDGNPHINILFSSSFDVIDCNPAAVKFFGFRSKNGLLNGFTELMQHSIPELQPGGRVSVPLAGRLEKAAREGMDEFETDLVMRGKPTPVSVMLKRIPYEDSFAIVAYAVDLSSLREARRKLGRQDYLLRTVNRTATRLLEADPKHFAKAVRESLKMLGNSVNADRLQVWENFEENGELCCRMIYSWAAGSGEIDDGKALHSRYADVPFWRENLCQDKSVNSLVRHLPPQERRILQPLGVLSTLIIPVFSQGEFWGFISYEDTETERVFSKLEESILKSSGLMIATAIMRNDAMQKLIEARDALQSRDKLLQAVAETATLLFANELPDFDTTLRQGLRILGQSVGTDRAYIWQNVELDGRLCCTPLAEWARGAPSAIGGSPDEPPVFIPYDELLPNWRDFLADSSNLNMLASGFDVSLAEFPGMHDVLSCLIIPIVLEGMFWGFIGFDDTTKERVYSKTQEDILASGGMLIASAIVRRKMTENLIEAREAALASMNAKTEFLSRMSHEIRTPMNAIIGMTTIARKSDDIDRIQQCLDKVDVSSRQLLSIINDVLDMSKIDANKLEILNEEFDFGRMMQNVVNVAQVRLDEKHQDFRLDMGGAFTRNVISDELRLSQVLINLLTNAVKFTPDGGRIELKVRAQAQDEDHALLRVEVADTGIGISAEQQAQLFQSFQQADGGITRQFGGTGLGLAISKRIVELMGGSIWVESEVGQGSTFIFEVPVAWGSPCDTGLAQRALNGNLRILVVDDTGDVREYFSNILAGFSVACNTAASGQEAVEMVQQALNEGAPYDLVFIDWNMPGMNGGETAQEIKRIMNDEIITVMISVAEWDEIEKDAKGYGVSRFLAKPVLPSVLYNTLVELTDQSLVTPRGADGDSKDWSRRRILLVEDIEINREIVMSILEETGVNIECATNGQEAVNKFADKPGSYDLILMDVQMPVLDGLAATRKIRASGLPSAQDVPIIAMTANAFKEDAQNCLDAGMNDHVAKPLEIDALFQVLGHYLDAAPKAQN